MTRISRTALVLLTVGTVACVRDITMHVEIDKRAVPIGLRQRAVEQFVHADAGRDPLELYGMYSLPVVDLGPVMEVLDVPLSSRLTDRTLHMRYVILDANGRPLYEGQGEATVADGATLTVIMSPTGPQ